MENRFGPNWKVAATGIGEAAMTFLTFLAGASYQLGDVALLIPPHWKAGLFFVSAVAAFLLRAIHATQLKSKNVSGTPATTQLVGSTPETLRAIPPPAEKLPDDKGISGQ